MLYISIQLFNKNGRTTRFIDLSKNSIPKLVDQIQKRGREYEENIRLDYLKRLNEYYNKWIDNYDSGKLLVIDIENLDFSENPDDMAEVIQKVDAEINGLF